MSRFICERHWRSMKSGFEEEIYTGAVNIPPERSFAADGLTPRRQVPGRRRRHRPGRPWSSAEASSGQCNPALRSWLRRCSGTAVPDGRRPEAGTNLPPGCSRHCRRGGHTGWRRRRSSTAVLMKLSLCEPDPFIKRARRQAAIGKQDRHLMQALRRLRSLLSARQGTEDDR